MVNRSILNKQLTESQQQVLDFIKDFFRANGSPPSYREIQSHFGYKAIGTVQDHVRALMLKGALEKNANKKNQRRARGLFPKGIRVEGVRRIPVYGEIAAGGPRSSEQLELGEVVIADDEIHGECFALRVVGESMIDIGIYEGDHLIVEMRNRAKHGEIVVALLDGETTVKRYSEKNGEIQLIPENKTMSAISTKSKKLEIQGRVVGLQRKI